MHLWQVSLAVDSESLIGYLLVTFGGAPGFTVADILDGAYLGPFKLSFCKPVSSYYDCMIACSISHPDLIFHIYLTGNNNQIFGFINK